MQFHGHYFFIILGIIIGKDIEEFVQQPNLKKLAKQVPEFLLAAKAGNTNKQYASYYRKFEKWCNLYREIKFPVHENYVGLYIVVLIQSGESFANIESSFYAIKWYHSFCDKNPCNYNVCKQLLLAAKRISRQPLQKKQPLSAENIHKIYQSVRGKNCSVLDLRLIFIMVLGFSRFMRYSEIADLKRCDFHFKDTHLEVSLEKSKTDIYRDVHWILLAKLQSCLCPMLIAKEYFKRAKITDDSDEFVFRAMTYMKSLNTYKLRKVNKPISYTSTREYVLASVSKELV